MSSQGLNRREFLHRASALALTFSLLPAPGGVANAQLRSPLAQLGVHPREEWAQGLPALGSMQQERPEDVKFLLVHHTASGNGYSPADVPGLIRGFYMLHTGPDKNWPDVAYNFFVDRYGAIWEGRTGSLTGPVMPDATGGSQGFAQLGCFIGHHQSEAPTDEARLAMIVLLAALADTYGIETAPGSMTSFVSRGSNRWAAGTPVTTTTIAGHRDMSQTACPGDMAYQLVKQEFPTEVTALRAVASTPPAATSAPATTSTPATPSNSAPPTTTQASSAAFAAGATADGGIWATPVPAVTGGVLAGGAGGFAAYAVLRRRAARAGTTTATDATQPIRPQDP
ncbi:MAG: N-acetylmuramoyl-L-alanine amidase [Actinomycetota bacterium]|nr:N-acetylmuramoyl-L-alanine amidase [Actinomycetota bacterium]